ncbi:hypothetical protein [Synechococcus phage MinM1]|nr:hypothetical protein [Synechococcus phage MinM1]
MTASASRFWIGEMVRVAVVFTDLAGAPMAPLGVQIRARKPDGTVHSYAVLDGALPSEKGADIAADQAGSWYVRASCAGPTPAAVEATFTVAASEVI